MAANQKKMAILVEEQYQVLEVWYPLLRLREEGIQAVMVGTGSKTSYPSKEGYPCKVDASIQDIKSKDFDGVVIPGGWAPDFLRRYPEIIRFVKELYKTGKIVASICHGGWVLVSADICRGNNLTSFIAIKDDVVAAGGRYLDQEVVVDKNLITSRKPEDLPKFTLEIINQLKKK